MNTRIKNEATRNRRPGRGGGAPDFRSAAGRSAVWSETAGRLRRPRGRAPGIFEGRSLPSGGRLRAEEI